LRLACLRENERDLAVHPPCLSLAFLGIGQGADPAAAHPLARLRSNRWLALGALSAAIASTRFETRDLASVQPEGVSARSSLGQGSRLGHTKRRKARYGPMSSLLSRGDLFDRPRRV
jgi:hypothetical protein